MQYGVLKVASWGIREHLRSRSTGWWGVLKTVSRKGTKRIKKALSSLKMP